MTLKRKLLTRIYLLTFLIILAMSGTYYYLFTRDIRERSYQNVTMAFNLIFDDLKTQAEVVASKVDLFIQSSLVNPIYVLEMFQGQQDTSEEEISVWYVKKLMTYLSSIATGIYEFGTLTDATAILVYDTQQQLLAAYRHEGETRITGVYLPGINKKTFVLMQPGDMWYATLQSLDEIPLQSLPENFPTSYPGPIPETLTVTLSTFNKKLSVRLTAPVINAGEIEGVCVIHIGIDRKDVLRYSRLSQTKVNVFAGNTFSVGLLPEYNTLSDNVLAASQEFDILNSNLPPIDFSDIVLGDHSYYQGMLVLGHGDDVVGAITTLFPRQLEQKQKKNLFIVITGIALLFSVLAAAEAVRLSGTIVNPITEMIQVIRKLSQGDLQGVVQDTMETKKPRSGWFSRLWRRTDQRDLQDSNNELAVLARALQTMVEYLQDMVGIMNHIAHGEINQKIVPRSEQDILNHSLGKMIMYIQEIANVAEKISNKDLQVEVTPKSDQDVLNQSLRKMVNNLQIMVTDLERSMVEVHQQNWLRTGQAELSDKMRGEQNLATLAKNIITYLAKYLQVQVGAIYLSEKKNGEYSLQLAGSYAYTQRKGNRNVFGMGEGLIGQAALEQEILLFTDVPEDYIKVSSGLGETVPQQILVTPFMYEGDVKGAIELATLREFSEIHQDFLEQACENIAIAVNSAQTRMQMHDLLEATQQQARELQVQQEQLQESNEALEMQARTLKESEEKLQVQQEELRQTNEELETQTKTLEERQRTLQEKNMALEKAQQLLQEKTEDLELTSKYKSEFLANMSHELRTPLNSLLILSRLLMENKDRNLSEKQVEFATIINSAGSDLLELINDILDLSKVEAGKMVLNIEDMSLNGFSTYVVQNFQHVANNKGLELDVKLNPSLPPMIRTDRQRVEQIIKNFLSNSLKFTEKGGITITIDRPASGTNLSQSGLLPESSLAITVADTGIGIPAEKQRLIFEAFQQVDGTTSRKYGGTGLGLSISRELAKILGGEVHLYSEEGTGSTFTLYLPEQAPITAGQQLARNDETPMVQGKTAPIEIPSTISLPTTRVETIWDDRHDAIPTDKFLLIIDDDPTFAKLLFDLAREKGFKSLLGGDGAAGLQLADQYLPSAIVLDIGLPDMDGWTVMQKLKENPDTRHIPVHVISAQDNSLEAMKMGAIGYMTKPVTVDKLNEALNTIEDQIAKTIKRLLVLEDENMMQRSIQELFGGDDVIITTAETGQKAHDLLKTKEFDCLVLDLGLADMSGFDFLDQIAGDEAIAQLPIIVYTGKDLSKDEEARLKQHAESIIIKGVHSSERLLDEVTLFLHKIRTELPETQQKRVRMLHDKEGVLQGKQILLVDDDMRNVFALLSVLHEKGLEVIVGENGREALELLEKTPELDLVLMDVMMPEMDGYETMQKIREQTQFNDLPIIALTAKAMKGDRQKCIEAGANDYLSKPIDIDKLLSLLRVWLY